VRVQVLGLVRVQVLGLVQVPERHRQQPS